MTPPQAVDIGESLLHSRSAEQIVTSSALLVLESERVPALREVCARAALVVADSAGISWAGKLLSSQTVRRLAGIDLAYALCERAAATGNRVFFLGGKPGVAGAAAAELKKRINHLDVAGCRDGFFQERDAEAVMTQIRQSGARLVLVALGMPRQDLWIHDNLNRLSPGVYIGVGGSFDVWAGQVRRAPGFMQAAGLEWLFRLIQEPFRWHRIALLPVFAGKVIRSRLSRKIDPN